MDDALHALRIPAPPVGHGSRFRHAAVVLTLALAACSRAPAGGGASGRGGQRTAAPVAVRVATVTERAMPVTVRSIGTAEASSTVEVRPQVSGPLLAVAFREGQDVKAGDLLFTIDPRPFQAALDLAEAALAKDAAQWTAAQAQQARIGRLHDEGLTSAADADAAAAQASALRASMQGDAAQVRNARLQLGYAQVVAPVAGRTGALLVHVGSQVRVNDTSPLVIINQVEPIDVSFAVPARHLPTIQAGVQEDGLPVVASVAGSGAAPATGTVSFVDNSVDPSSDTIRLKATFGNEDHGLWPGQVVDVALELSVDQRAVVVPAQAVQPSQSGFLVHLVKPDQTIEVRTVELARIDGADAIIAKGLQAGEVVVTDGQLGLTPGARVAVETAPAPASAPAP